MLVLSTTSVLAQEKALSIDANGDITIEGALNGVRFYNFEASDSIVTLKGIGSRYATLTISYVCNCQVRGISAVVSYTIDQPDDRLKIFKILSQAGTNENNVSVSPTSRNKLIFTDDCGVVTELIFTPQGSDVIVRVVVIPSPLDPNPISNIKFNIISQGF